MCAYMQMDAFLQEGDPNCLKFLSKGSATCKGITAFGESLEGPTAICAVTRKGRDWEAGLFRTACGESFLTVRSGWGEVGEVGTLEGGGCYCLASLTVGTQEDPAGC